VPMSLILHPSTGANMYEASRDVVAGSSVTGAQRQSYVTGDGIDNRECAEKKTERQPATRD
jgi:hypothetical protein